MSHDRPELSSLTRLITLLIVCLAAALLLTACGGSGKPSYCSKVSDLEQSIKDLANVKPVQNGTSSVTSAVDNVKNNADAAYNALKSDFPSEASAVKTSIDNLANSAKSLPSSIPQIPGQVTAVTTAVTNLVNATKSKCS